MWIKNDRTICEMCGILLFPFYPIPEDRTEMFLCPECMDEHIKTPCD